MNTFNIKTYILAPIVAMAMGAQAQTIESGAGARVDYLDAKGNVLYSNTPNYGGVAFQVEGNDAPDITSYLGGNIASMKFTQWGTESYLLTVDSEQRGDAIEAPKVSFEITDDSGNSKTYTAGESVDVLCGTPLHFIIDVPQGTYPTFELTEEMTRPDLPFEFGSIGENVLMNWPSMVFSWVNNKEQLQSIADRVNSTVYFERDKNNPNRWYLDWTMENEPLRFVFYTKRKDFELLKNITLQALNELYYQNSDLWNVKTGGEPLFMGLFGDYISQDFVSGLYSITAHDTAVNFPNMENMKRANGHTAHLWRTAQAYITHANMILQYLDNFDATTDSERDWARAQMLSLRSLGYIRMMQIYGVRWQDSNNGEAFCTPLETSFPAFDQPLARMKDIRDQCYADLDEAVSLFNSHDWTKDAKHLFDAKTSLGLKVRMAMLCEDWNIARDLTEKILDGVTLTSNEDLKAGFFKPSDSWIWSVSNYRYDPNNPNGSEYNNNLYYMSFQSYNAVNGTYPAAWAYGSNAIDKDLYLSMSTNDIRKSLFIMPDLLPRIPSAIPYNETESWYKAENFDSNKMYAIQNGSFIEASKKFNRLYSRKNPEGVVTTAFSQIEGYNQYIPVMLGAQVKFYQPGESQSDEAYVVLMRSEEMLLDHAEACYHLGDYTKATEDLQRLNGMRDSEYSFSGTDDVIMDEIIRTRKIELWGEGHSWYDQKRWNMPIKRRSYESGNSESGNWHPNISSEIPVDFANSWRWVIPAMAVSFNPQINLDLMNYTEIQTETPASAPEKLKTVDSKIQKVNFKQENIIQEMQEMQK